MNRSALAILGVLLIAAVLGVWLVMGGTSEDGPRGSVTRRAESGERGLPTFEGAAPAARPAGEIRPAVPDEDGLRADSQPPPTGPMRRVSGQVVRASDGTPFPHCRLFVPRKADSTEITFKHDAPRGNFEFSVAMAATHLEVEAIEPWQGKDQTVALPAGDVDDLRIVFDSGFILRGRVADDAGSPLPGAGVEITTDDIPPVTTDAAGNFELKDIVPGEGTNSARCSAWAAWHSREVVYVMAPSDVTFAPTVELRLRGSGALEGTVTDAAGAPFPLQPVTVLWQMTDQHGAAVGTHLRDTTAEEGRYRIDNVPAGRYVVRGGVATEDERQTLDALIDTEFVIRPVPRVVADVEVRAGQVTHLDFALPRGASISGRVMDGAGAPVEDVALTLRNVLRWPAPEAEGESISTDDGGLEIVTRGERRGAAETMLSHPESAAESDALGNYLLPDLAEGEKRLTATVADGRLRPLTRTLQVHEGEQLVGIDFVLAVGLVVRGRVTEASGAPIAGATVYVKPHDENIYALEDGARTDDAGRFEITGLPPDNQQLTIMKSGFATLRQDIEPGGADQTYVLRHAPRVRGEVTDTINGQPIEVLNVSVETRGSSWSTTGSRYTGGRFAVDVDDDAACTVRVSADGFLEDVREDVVPSLTETAPLRFRLVPRP